MDPVLKQAMSSASQAAQSAQQAQKDQDKHDKEVDAKKDEQQDYGNISQPVRAAKAKLDAAYNKGNKHHKDNWKADKNYKKAESEYRQAKSAESSIRDVKDTINQGDNRSESNRTNAQSMWEARAHQANSNDTSSDETPKSSEQGEAKPNKDTRDEDRRRGVGVNQPGMGKNAQLAGRGEGAKGANAAAEADLEGKDAYTSAKDQAPRALYSAGSPAGRASDLPEVGEVKHEMMDSEGQQDGGSRGEQGSGQQAGAARTAKAGAGETTGQGKAAGQDKAAGQTQGAGRDTPSDRPAVQGNQQASSAQAPAAPAGASKAAANPAAGAAPVQFHAAAQGAPAGDGGANPRQAGSAQQGKAAQTAQAAAPQRAAATGSGTAPVTVGAGQTQTNAPVQFSAQRKDGGATTTASTQDSAAPAAGGQYGASRATSGGSGRAQTGSGNLGGNSGRGSEQGSFNLPVTAASTGQGKSAGGVGVSKADVSSSPMVANSGSALSSSQESSVRGAAGRYFAGLKETDDHEQFTKDFIKDMVDNFDKNSQDEEGHYKNVGKGGKGGKGAKGAKGAKTVATAGGVAGPGGAAGTGSAKTTTVEEGAAGLTAGGSAGGGAGKSAATTGSGKSAASTGAGSDTSSTDETQSVSESSDGGGGSNMTAMEFVQLVMMQAFAEAGKDAEVMAKTLQAQTKQKAAFRAQESGLQSKVTYDNQNVTSEGKAAQDQLDNLEASIDAIGDDNQLAFIRLQNLTQLMTTMSQAASNVSKNLYDVEKSTIGNIGH